ncbi:MAG: PIN domain-containing protein [Anaerolineae bacterium]|nr:PIN domain-containing protein [Anaerolineae bacterium]
MTIAIADTTVVIHLYRRYAPALRWYESLPQSLGIAPITWMEVMYGAGSKAKQTTCKALLGQFDLIHLTSGDQDWAMQQMEKYRLSHGLAAGDCFIASVAYRLQLPLYTHNLKDMTRLIGGLAVKPYD